MRSELAGALTVNPPLEELEIGGSVSALRTPAEKVRLFQSLFRGRPDVCESSRSAYGRAIGYAREEAPPTVLGVPATVQRVELSPSDEIVAICRRRPERQLLPILDLPLPTPPPDGAEWIEAYRRWLRDE